MPVRRFPAPWSSEEHAAQPRAARALANEIKYPYIVELPVEELDAELSRQITVFHSSQKLRAWQGRQITKENKIYCRWCFSDLTTAGAFIERFGGTIYKR
jgi:hypothetical protein